MSKKILVILGGSSKEREVSLETGKSCIKALKKRKAIGSTDDHPAGAARSRTGVIPEGGAGGR